MEQERKYRKIKETDNNLSVGIPKAFLDKLGIGKGDEMEVVLNENKEVIMRPSNKQVAGDDGEMIKMLYQTFDDHDDLFKSLKDK